MLAAVAYFDRADDAEREIRDLSEQLYARVDWQWALNGGSMLSHGWTPERGFLPYRWEGYDEALLLYVLALGSVAHSIPSACYDAWVSTYEWRSLFDTSFLFAGLLFIHQLSHVWIDFRGIQDAVMRAHDCDYFENSRRATLVQQQYAMRNPRGFEQYGEWHWGITASNGPGKVTRTFGGVRRKFFGDVARGVPDGPDDGTLAPWGVIASLPFAPEIVLPTIASMRQLPIGCEDHPYGFRAAYNPTFLDSSGPPGWWVSPNHCDLNQGPIVVMVENYRSELIWKLLRTNSHIVAGLRTAGFTRGWLSSPS